MSHNIAICLPRIDDQVQRDVLHAIINAAENDEKYSDYKFYVFSTYSDITGPTPILNGELKIFSIIDYISIDALLVFPERFYWDDEMKEIISAAKKKNIPVLSIGKIIPEAASIGYGMGSSISDIVSHVIEHHGCKYINFIAGKKAHEATDDRLKMFKETIARYGLPSEPERIGWGEFWDFPTEQVMEKFYQSELPFPEAIICANDVMAITAISSLRQHGYKVPKDVIVTGFDGIDMERFHNPRLTTAVLDYKKLADKVMEYIDMMCSGKEIPKESTVDFIKRISESCGCSIEETPDNYQLSSLWKEVSCDIGFSDEVTRMSSSLILKGSFDEILGSIADFFNHIFTSEVRVCLFSDYVTGLSDDVKYAENAVTDTVYSALEKHGDESVVTFADRTFPIADIVPDKKYGGQDFRYLILFPLHYNDIVYGYVAANTDIDHICMYQLRALSMHLGFVCERISNFKYMEAINKHLEKTSFYDSMTGLMSRNGYYSLTKKMIEPQLSQNKHIVIISADLDNLKDINDKFGHACGDKAIKIVADTLYEYIGKDGIAARFGGDEFVGIKLFDESPDSFIQKFSEGFSCTISDKVEENDLEYNVSASFGIISLLTKNLPSLEEGIKSADVLMYAQKRAKKRAGRSTGMY